MATMAAPPAVASSSECAMPGGDMPDQPADHDKMPCCTSNCTMAGFTGLPQPASADLAEPMPVTAPLTVAAVKQLVSLHWATADPPPRTTLF